MLNANLYKQHVNFFLKVAHNYKYYCTSPGLAQLAQIPPAHVISGVARASLSPAAAQLGAQVV